MSVIMIAAHDGRRGIGRAGQMAWHIPGESRWTAATTRRTARPELRNALVMGRKTYDSIPQQRRPLAGRTSIVISTATEVMDDGVYLARGLKEAIQRAATLENIGDTYIFGGATIYRQALDQLIADELLISVVPGDYQCDAHLPDIPDDYTLTSSTIAHYGASAVRHERYQRTSHGDK